MKKFLILCSLAILTITLMSKKSQNYQILDQQPQAAQYFKRAQTMEAVSEVAL